MIRRPPRSTLSSSSAASDVYKRQLFAELESMKKKPNEEEASRFFKLTNSIYKDLTRDELVDKYYDEYCEDLDIELTEDEIPDEMLGIAPGSVQISDSTRSLFMEIYDLAHEKPKKASKLLEEFRKTNTDIPAFYFLELSILQENKSKKYTQKLNEYAAKFPDYPLIRLLWMENKISTKTAQEEYLINSYDMKFFFHERTSLHVQ